jgi:hypothetical protein
MIDLDTRPGARVAPPVAALRTAPAIIRRLARLLREPLLHFMVVGAVIFFAAQAWRADHDQHRIVVTADTVAELAGKHRLQYGRSPTAAELERAIDAYVEEEMLYREGRALGLDRDDEIVRRRVAQKATFLRQDLAIPAEPTAAELERYFRAHAARYAEPARTSFRHLYFSPDVGGADGARRRAEAALARLTAGAAADDVGTDAFPDQPAYVAVGPAEAQRLFGATPMAAAVATAPLGRWSGPVRSGYGWHLVFAQSRAAGAPGDLARLHDRVRGDWLHDAQAAANARAMATLRARYTVVRREGDRP